MEQITSIPVMLSQNKHNISEVARQLKADRGTVRNLADDKECHHHIVVRGRLMTETRGYEDG
ncbi:hypothetical protein [Rosenbergiella epipactidis]|uniref:hypothetical protein n=1 Tax=Rosenbergiella epipactidis TaxID=1544694 RepID=UPI003B970E03